MKVAPHISGCPAAVGLAGPGKNLLRPSSDAGNWRSFYGANGSTVMKTPPRVRGSDSGSSPESSTVTYFLCRRHEFAGATPNDMDDHYRDEHMLPSPRGVLVSFDAYRAARGITLSLPAPDAASTVGVWVLVPGTTRYLDPSRQATVTTMTTSSPPAGPVISVEERE